MIQFQMTVEYNTI